MAGLTLTYLDQKNAVLERRFPTSSPVAQWLAAGYQDVWSSAAWTFKHVSLENWYTTSDGLVSGTVSATPQMPTAFQENTLLLDDNGGEVVQLPQSEFEREYGGDTATGRPEAFTVVNRQIKLGPIPSSAYLFLQSYKRRLATRQADGTVQAGFYALDTDVPLWDDHHYLLVLRAKLLGLRDRSDPTASDLQDEYMGLLEAMREDYVEKLPAGHQLPAYR